MYSARLSKGITMGEKPALHQPSVYQDAADSVISIFERMNLLEADMKTHFAFTEQ